MNWKGELAQFLTFTAAPVAGVALAWIALRRPFSSRSGRPGFMKFLVLTWLATRVGMHLAVFHVFRYAGGHDLLAVWEPIAKTVLAGGDPTPLVDNLYGPLFPQVLAFGYFLGGGASAPLIDVPFLLADLLSVLFLLRIARRRLSEDASRRITLFFLLAPLLWQGTVVRTQDEALFVVFLLLTLDCVDRDRTWLAGFAAALGMLLTKGLFPLFVFPILLARHDGFRRTAGRVAVAGGLTLAGLGVAVALGWDPAARVHSTLDVRGSSLWFLLIAEQPGRTAFLIGLAGSSLLMVLAAGAALIRREGEDLADRAARGVVAVQAAFFVFSPFTLPPHLALAMPFLAWQVLREGAARRKAPAVALLLLLALSAWQALGLRLNSEHWRLLPLLILTFVLWNAWTGWRAFRSPWGRPEEVPA